MHMKFENFLVGDMITFEKKFEIADYKKFADLSGDYNPLHHDPDYAVNYGDGFNIVPLHLIIGSLSRIAGMNFPGTPSLYLNHTVRAINQLQYGEALTFSAKIISLNAAKRIMTLRVLGVVGSKIIFDAELTTQALHSDWEQAIDCEVIQSSSKKRVLITGASGEIAYAVARKFYNEGWSLLLQSRTKQFSIDTVTKDWNQASVEIIEAKLNTCEGLEALTKTIERLGDVSAIVHTASPPVNSSLNELVEVNYSVLKSITEAALHHMLIQQGGKVMSIGSTAMLTQIDGFEDYAAAKSMAASYLARINAKFSSYGVEGRVFAPNFVSTEYSKDLRGDAPSLLPAEVATKLFDTINDSTDFMTIQNIGSLAAGKYGFAPSNRPNTSTANHETKQQNNRDEFLVSKTALNERLVLCVKRILPKASSEQIYDGGMGLTPGWDSLAAIQILLEVEGEFKKNFSSDEFEHLKTYNEIVSNIQDLERFR